MQIAMKIKKEFRLITVLHVLNEIRPSGGEVMIKIASPYWKESGVELHALSTAKAVGAYSDKLSNAGILIHHIPFSNSLNFYFRMINLIRSNHVDVVHIHTEQTFLTFVILARLAGVTRIIRTIHNNYLFEGIIRFNRSIRRWIVRKLGVIQVSISVSVKQNEKIRLGNPTYLINNWYDDAHFSRPSQKERNESRQALGVMETEKVILSIGNCSKVKNHTAIIHALELLKQNGLSPFYWHIGEEDAQEEERNLVHQLGLDAQVLFWGRQDDVRPFLWAADVFVMPSLYEGFAVALVEALASGLPAVLARTPGLDQWDAIIPELTYTDVTPDDLSRGLKKSLQAQYKTDKTKSILLKDKFGLKRGAQEYLDLYEGRIKNGSLIIT